MKFVAPKGQTSKRETVLILGEDPPLKPLMSVLLDWWLREDRRVCDIFKHCIIYYCSITLIKASGFMAPPYMHSQATGNFRHSLSSQEPVQDVLFLFFFTDEFG